MQLTSQNLYNEHNATCMGTQTSKVPTWVTILFIFFSVLQSLLIQAEYIATQLLREYLS